MFGPRPRHVPSEPTALSIEYRGKDGEMKTSFVFLKEVRDGFAFTSVELDGGHDYVYCLHDGARDCYEEGGEFLTAESLEKCRAWYAKESLVTTQPHAEPVEELLHKLSRREAPTLPEVKFTAEDIWAIFSSEFDE